MRARSWMGGAALAAAGSVGAAALYRHRIVRAVAPELRRRGDYLPFSIGSRRELALVRRGVAAASVELLDGVERVVLDSGVPVFVHRPSTPPEGPVGALLWMHGGGFIMGTAAADQSLCAPLAEELGIVVVAVDYRLAPEHPFPAPLDDCHAALTWLHASADELGVDPARIAVGGASAGGGLAACLAQRAHDQGGAPVAFQLLIYPMLDDRTAVRPPRAPAGRVMWTPRSNRFGWSCYLDGLPGEGEAADYAAAGRRTDLRGLPPAWIGVGGVDLFHDEDVAYAERLAEAGVAVDLHVEPGMPHGADALWPDVPTMRGFRAAWVTALDTAIG